MDTQTRRALKGDKFAQAAASGVTWFSGHRTVVTRWLIVAGIVLVLGLGAWIFWAVENSSASSALGAAIDTYNAPLMEPGMPQENGVFATSADRTKAATKQFRAIAQKYGWLPAGKKALYFLGVTDEQMGQFASAETELKAAASTWNRNISSLAKLALAGLYRREGKDAQAIQIYKALAAKPTETVSAAMAQLDLADLYAAEGKMDQARILWAKVKDMDKEGAAGAIAAQELSAPQ